MTYVELLYHDLAAQRNPVTAEVKELEAKLAEKPREVRSLHEAMEALKKPGRRR